MSITICLLLSLMLHAPLHVHAAAEDLKRPDFYSEVKELLGDMAEENKYETNTFDRCHIVPWGFIKNRINENKNLDDFIDDLAEIHDDAAFYKNVKAENQEKIKKFTEDYKAAAKEIIKDKYLTFEDKKKLAKSLFNFPSNLYPGDEKINKEIANNLDPPKKVKGSEERSNEATEHAKELYMKYKDSGLNIKEDSGKALSSDKPPDDSSDKYITIS